MEEKKGRKKERKERKDEMKEGRKEEGEERKKEGRKNNTGMTEKERKWEKILQEGKGKEEEEDVCKEQREIE